MSKLPSYRVSYRIAHVYYIDVEASSPEHAADWTQTLLNRFGTAIHGSRNIRNDCRVSDVEIVGTPLRTYLPAL
jgi:hypothetical protein